MKSFRKTCLLATVILLVGGACWAGSSEISDLLPWTDKNRAALGMTKAEFTKSRPAAVEVDLGDAPPPPDRPFNGGYIEGDATKPGSDLWIYTFKAGHLRTVWWARKNDASEADTEKIRRRLMEAYGGPKIGSLARMTADGKIERITRELYLTARSGGYAVYLAATDSGGIEVTVMSVSDPEFPLPEFDDSVPRLGKEGLPVNEGKPTITDILAKVSRKNLNPGK